MNNKTTLQQLTDQLNAVRSQRKQITHPKMGKRDIFVSETVQELTARELCLQEELNTEKRTQKFRRFYMRVAKETAELSYCVRHKVGAVIVSPDHKNIIGFGYNGTPGGFDNTCEINNVTKREVLHAETNAIMKVALSTQSSQNCYLYTTLSPCFDCAKLIIQSGITTVVYDEKYRDSSGLELLEKANIQVIKYS